MKNIEEEETSVPQAEIVGTISREHRIVWAVSPYRQDRRTGATTCNPMSDYCKSLHEMVSIR